MRDTIGTPYVGTCDGCETPTPQFVHDVSGDWGAATVCVWHLVTIPAVERHWSEYGDDYSGVTFAEFED
jgi:hypothetical protein